MFAFCLFSVANNWLLRTNLLCVMDAWTTFCGIIVRNSVWAPNAALLPWSVETIWSLFHFLALWNPLLSSISLTLSVVYLQFLLSHYTETVLKSWNPACISKIILTPFFLMYLGFAGLTLLVYSSVSEIYFWLLWQICLSSSFPLKGYETQLLSQFTFPSLNNDKYLISN